MAKKYKTIHLDTQVYMYLVEQALVTWERHHPELRGIFVPISRKIQDMLEYYVES